MNMKLDIESERSLHPSPHPTDLEARLGRLEGFLHHLMSDVREALELVASVREAAGLNRVQQASLVPPVQQVPQ